MVNIKTSPNFQCVVALRVVKDAKIHINRASENGQSSVAALKCLAVLGASLRNGYSPSTGSGELEARPSLK